MEGLGVATIFARREHEAVELKGNIPEPDPVHKEALPRIETGEASIGFMLQLLLG